MSTLDDWIEQAAGALELPADSISTDLRNELLDLTRDVAHGVARIAGPLTCYLVGVAVGKGAEPAAALASLTALLPAQSEPEAESAAAAGVPGKPVAAG